MRLPAEQVFTARFREDYWGIARERYRVAILAAGAVAIADINVRDSDAWQRYQRGIMAFLESLKIGAPAPAPAAVGEPLTAREQEVMRWLSGGKTDRDIGDILGISPRTVHKHLQRIYEKLGVETRTAAVVRFLQKSP